jgi:hypothetical protein
MHLEKLGKRNKCATSKDEGANKRKCTTFEARGKPLTKYPKEVVLNLIAAFP